MNTSAQRVKTLETLGILALAAMVLGMVFHWMPWLVLAGSLLIIGAFFKKTADAVAGAWMKFGHAIGFLNTRLLLILVYYLVLTPLAIAYRVVHGDFLRLRDDRPTASLWYVRDHPYTPRDLETMW